MGSKQVNKPHVVCISGAAQGHINPMLKLAKILHAKGFDVTFVNTEFTHERLLRSLGSDTLRGLPSSFRFETIPDGLPPPKNKDASQDTATILKSLHETALGPLKSVIAKVSASYSPVTCMVADFLMYFTLTASKELGIPGVLFWTAGGGSLICYDEYRNLIQKGLMPLKGTIFLFLISVFLFLKLKVLKSKAYRAGNVTLCIVN